MSQPHAAAKFVENIIPDAILMAGVSAHETAAVELSRLQDETISAKALLQAFRDKTSDNPKADLIAAFEHIDNAILHSRLLREETDVTQASDVERLHLSMQYFQTVLSDIPQISFLNGKMVDSFLEIKNALLQTRQMLDR